MPIGTSYLAGSADTVQNYADTYVSFTTNLITDTFEALLQAHHSQIEAYAELVGTISKGLTTYINDTKSEITPLQLLEFVSKLPLKQAEALSGEEYIAYNDEDPTVPPLTVMQPSATPGAPDEPVQGKAFSQVLKNIFNPASTIGSGVKQTIEGVKSIFSEPIDKDRMESFPAYEKFQQSILLNDEQTIQDDFMQLARSVISYNKFGLLENMVETGLLRLVVDRGLIQTEFNMELTESYSDSSTNSYKNRVTTKDKSRSRDSSGRGITRILGRRSSEVAKSKRKTLTVTKQKNSNSNDTSGTAQLKAKVEIHFSTDYKPLLTDRS